MQFLQVKGAGNAGVEPIGGSGVLSRNDGSRKCWPRYTPAPAPPERSALPNNGPPPITQKYPPSWYYNPYTQGMQSARVAAARWRVVAARFAQAPECLPAVPRLSGQIAAHDPPREASQRSSARRGSYSKAEWSFPPAAHERPGELWPDVHRATSRGPLDTIRCA